MKSYGLSSHEASFLPFEDLAKRGFAYGVSTVFGTRSFSAIELLSGMLISGMNSVVVTIGQSLNETEEDLFKKGALATGAIALSTIAISYTVAPLMNVVGLVASRGMLIRIACFNALGEAAKIGFPIVLDRISAPPRAPTTPKEVNEFSGLNIQYMHEHFEDYQSMSLEVRRAFEDRLCKMEMLPSMPQSVEEVGKLELFAITYIRNHFEDFQGMTPEVRAAFEKRLQKMKLFPSMPKTLNEIQQLDFFMAFYIKTQFKSFLGMSSEMRGGFDQKLEEMELLPEVPESVEDIDSLGLFDVIYIFENYREFLSVKHENASSRLVIVKDMEEPVLRALHLRFFNADLPFPEKRTVKTIKDQGEEFPLIYEKPPQTVEAVEALKENQLSWVFGSMAQNGENSVDYKMSSLTLDVQAALYAAFRDTLPDGLDFIPHPTVINVTPISPQTAEILCDYYKEGLDKFVCLPMDLKTALNEKFDHAQVDSLPMTYDPKSGRIQDKDAEVWRRYFVNNNNEWFACGPDYRSQFNRYFAQEDLDGLEVPHMLGAPEVVHEKRSFYGLFNY